jgi:hypothetical protein
VHPENPDVSWVEALVAVAVICSPSDGVGDENENEPFPTSSVVTGVEPRYVCPCGCPPQVGVEKSSTENVALGVLETEPSI